MATSKTKIATRHHKRLSEISNSLKNLAIDALLEGTFSRETQLELDEIQERLEKLAAKVTG